MPYHYVNTVTLFVRVDNTIREHFFLNLLELNQHEMYFGKTKY